ncbi:ATP-binding protein [Caproiciproducens faecalis]|uniref:histidine kinase n=1 Tax=Caproiciproducens faecalis TaxID=2820301 RepID=A0ABS7DRC9_9FIRM|nr:ATP-binding protein [Caproiciproducens faecalis]MBW7573849.1 DUF4118 domain-containing protein [Caproiciproducens faecalis]
MDNNHPSKLLKPIVQTAEMVLILAGATLLSMLFKNTGLSEINTVVIYILSVLIVSRITNGYVYGICASVLGMFCFNFFFTEPYHTFNVYNKDYLVTFFVMLTASILTSTLTSKIMDSNNTAKQREKQSNILFQITSSLAKAASVQDIATVSVKSLSNLLDCDVCCVTMDTENAVFEEYSLRQSGRTVDIRPLNAAELETLTENLAVQPIADKHHQYALICLPYGQTQGHPEEEKLLSSICVQIFAAMERERLSAERKKAKNDAEREKFKSNLLRAISHDLRTPLAGIAGVAEILLYSLKDENNIRLVQGIYDDSRWLTQMVENILSLTRIQEGKLVVRKQQEAVEEIVGEAVSHASKYADGRSVEIEIPNDVIFVPMDGKLIEQVLINLINNSIKHTSPGDTIQVTVKPGKDQVWFSVSDNGTGIEPRDLPKIFDLFYTEGRARADSKRGLGLGLAICKTIVNAHGGKITAENNKDGGATIRFYLPDEGSKNGE